MCSLYVVPLYRFICSEKNTRYGQQSLLALHSRTIQLTRTHTTDSHTLARLLPHFPRKVKLQNQARFRARLYVAIVAHPQLVRCIKSVIVKFFTKVYTNG